MFVPAVCVVVLGLLAILEWVETIIVLVFGYSQSPIGCPLYLIFFLHFFVGCTPDMFSNSVGVTHLASNRTHFPTDLPVKLGRILWT